MTPRERLESAVDTWNETRSFRFALQLENRSLPLDEGGMLTYNSVQGDVVAPDRMQAETLVRTPVGNTQVALIAIGDEQWITNPLTRRWEPAPPETAGGVGGMFDPETGIGSMLRGMENPQIAGEETLDGARVYRLTGGLPGSVLAGFAADLQDVPRLDVDLLIDSAEDRIRQIVVREPAGANGLTPTWTFNFSNFDQPVAIEPPATL